MPVYQMVSNGTDRVLVLTDTNARRARGRFPCVADSAMSFRTTAFRVSVFLGLATVVAAILWLTPPPREYWARLGLGLELCLKTVIMYSGTCKTKSNCEKNGKPGQMNLLQSVNTTYILRKYKKASCFDRSNEPSSCLISRIQ
jgi:hypothetical protein